MHEPAAATSRAGGGGSDGGRGSGWAEALADPRRPWSARWDAPLAVLLGLLTLWLRWSQRSRTPYTVDSVLFALATERYDVMALRPHPPGYPVFVAVGKALLPVVGGDANAAFVLESALFSAVAVSALYALVRQWGSMRAALACALLFLVAPAFAFNGTIALSYTAEAAAGIVVALLAWRVATRPTPASLAALGVAWALGVGIRQSLFMFLAPLVALALVGLPLPERLPRDRAAWAGLLRRAAVAGSASLATALAWFLPMAAATGGLAEWRRATRLQGDQVVFADAVWERGLVAFQEHWDRLAYFLHWEVGLLLPTLAVLVLAGLVVRSRRRRAGASAASAAPAVPDAWPRGAGLLLAVWLLPALAFYLLVFDGWERGPIGYVLTLLPGLYAGGVLLADQGLRTLAAAQRPPLARALAPFGLVLLLLPLPPLASEANALIGREAHAHDEWADAWQRLEADYPPNSTAILAWQSWSHVQWSFPDHLAWAYFPSYKVPGQTDWAMVFAMRHREHEARFIEMYLEGPGRPHHPIPPEIRAIVLFDFQLAGEGGEERRIDPSIPVEEARLSNGWRILLLRPGPSHPTVESLFTAEALGASRHAGVAEADA